MQNKPIRRCTPLAAVVLFLCACGDANSGQSPESRAAVQRTFPVQALDVVPRDLSRVVRVSAVVEPRRQIDLAAETDGVLMELTVEEGDRVQAGDVLARIDVREQRAELARAQARLEEQRASYERLARLRDGDYVDVATYEAARAGLGIAEAEVRLWQTRVEFGILRAPVDATVIDRHFEPGEAVSRLQPIYTLADLDTLVVRLGVSELDIHGLDANIPVQITVDALPDREPLQGRIQRIFPAARTDSRLVTVEVALPEAARRSVRPGYLARARLVVAAYENALAVPINSLGEQPDGESYVMVINGDDRLERRTVVPGITRGAWQEITAGLNAGERIVAYNPMELDEGSMVRIVGWAG
jgi:membrane fusion protein, multidrug efflux system